MKKTSYFNDKIIYDFVQKNEINGHKYWSQCLKTTEEDIWHLVEGNETSKSFAGTLEVLNQQTAFGEETTCQDVNVQVDFLHFRVLKQSPKKILKVNYNIATYLSVEWQKYLMQIHGVSYAYEVLKYYDMTINQTKRRVDDKNQDYVKNKNHYEDDLKNLETMKENAENYIVTHTLTN